MSKENILQTSEGQLNCHFGLSTWFDFCNTPDPVIGAGILPNILHV